MTKVFSSLPTNTARPALVGRTARTWTSTTALFIRGSVSRGGASFQFFQALNEQTEEKADIGDDAHGFQRAAIRQLRHDGGVDVDADELHAGRGHVPDPDRVEHARKHQDHLRAPEEPGVIPLRAEKVHLGVGHGAVVANGARERKRHPFGYAFVEDAAGERLLPDRRGETAATPDEVDGLQVVLMAAAHGDAPLEIDPERSAQQALLDIVDGDGVPAEEGLHVPVADEAREVFPRARMDDHRAGHDGDLASLFPYAAEFPRDLVHHQLDAALARNARAHEAEFLRAPRRARLRFAHGADSPGADDDALPRLQVAQQRAARGRFVHHDDAVHALGADEDPFPPDMHLGGINGRRIEIVRGDSRLRDPPQDGVADIFRRQDGAQVDELGDDALQRLFRWRRHVDLGLRNALPLAAKVEAEYLKTPAVLDRDIQGAVEQPGIEQMPFQPQDPALDKGARAFRLADG